MPLYDYKCMQCERVFEIQQKMLAEPLTICPECKGKLRRLISPAGIVFKGSGFHVTDYGKGSGGRGQGIEKTKETKSLPAASSPQKSK